MDLLGGCSITALADLLNPPEHRDYDSDEDKSRSGVARMGPGDVGGRRKTEAPPGGAEAASTEGKAKENSKDIWGQDEVGEGAEFDDTCDPREQPQYEMVYKQAVTSEDMFLQMGSKNASTASCEDLVVRVTLPGTKLSEIVLDVKETFFDCRTTKFKLGLYLPHRVDAKNTRAQWDADRTLLTVTLRLNRDLDCMNF